MAIFIDIPELPIFTEQRTVEYWMIVYMNSDKLSLFTEHTTIGALDYRSMNIHQLAIFAEHVAIGALAVSMNIHESHMSTFTIGAGAPVAQWFKRWPIDLAVWNSSLA